MRSKKSPGGGAGGSAPREKVKRTPGEVFNDFLLMVAGILSPVIPALIAAGFLATVLAIMQLAFGVTTDNSTYKILNNFAQAAFYFLPVFVAYTSAKKFDTEPVLAMLLACGLLYPDWVSMAAEGGFTSYFGIPVLLTTYNGAVIQIILSVWIMSKIDRVLKRIIPEVARHFLKPFLLILIMSVITLSATGPLGGLVTNYIGAGVDWVRSVAPWAGVPAIVLLSLTVGLVAPGFHLALIPIATTSIATVGYDDLINIWFFCCTITPGFIGLAVTLMSKSSNCRQVALPAALSSLFGGISEPCLYGVLFKMVKPWKAYAVTSFTTAILAGLLHLKCYAFGGYSLTNIMLYLGPDLDYANFTNALLLVGYMLIMSFITVKVFGFDDSVYDAEDEDGQPIEVETDLPAAHTADLAFEAPVKGAFVAQADIADETFAAGVLGACFGTKAAATEGVVEVKAPVAGEVTLVAKTAHAVGIKTPDGAEVLLHVGIDSVKLEGRGMETFVQVGDQVVVGQKVVSYDASVFAAEGIDPTVITILANSASYAGVAYGQGGVPMLARA